ncbi:WD repeat-containing protein 70 [Blomia tropicalis]|nr:WD repeat-containing protein 70 [Blomia tropicalis]
MIKFNLNNKNKSSNSTITTPKAFNTEDETESNSQMQQIMGFGTFGRIEKPKADNKPPMNQLHKTSTNELGMKAARKFDVEELMRQHLENTATNMKSESSDKDPNGARLVTGAIDYEVKYWDFQGMDSTLQSFRTIRPCQSHSIKHLEYNSNGELILVVSGSCIAKLVDRDGFVKAETIKGDQYIADKNNTKGHMAMLNAGTWHPMERNVFATASNDSTARLWDITKVSGREIRSHTTLIKPRSKTGFFTQPNSICFSSIGDLIALGCNDGSIQMWDTRRSYVNTTHLIRPAHSQDEITSIRFSYSGNHLLSRAMDSTMKLWDMRMLKSSKRSYTPGKSQFDPLHVWDSLFNRYSQTDCFFSPDDRLAVTGVGCDERSSSNEYGHLKFFDCSTFELVQDVKCALRSSVIRTLWHPKLNQIVASSSDGSVRMLYDLERSSRGALLCSFRMKRKKKDVFSDATPQIITPHALPMFKQERRKSKFVQMIKDRKDPVKSHQPELPVTGAGAGGRLASAGKTFASFIAKSLGVRAKIDDNEDPRTALLKYAKDAEENPYWVTPAYQSTQPKAIFTDSENVGSGEKRGPDEDNQDDNEEEDGERKRFKHIPAYCKSDSLARKK